MTRDEIFEDIKDLAIAYTGAKPEKLTRETRLLSDLSLDGDPAAGFMAAFTNKFGVDMSGFYWLRYFGDEGFDPLAPGLIAAARRVSPRFERRYRAALAEEREITLEHLTEAAQAKAWIHPGGEHALTRKRRPLTGLFAILGALGVLTFCVVGAIALYGLAAGAWGEISLVSAAAVIAAAALPAFWVWNAWRNIQRKLASGPAS